MGGANVTGFRPPAKGVVLGEVQVRVLKYQTDPLLERAVETLYVALATGTKVGLLKRRIQGLTHLPETRIRLMLCGSVLEDAEAVPLEAFELTNKTSDDDDVFRPRIYLTLRPEPEALDKPLSEASQVSEIDEEELRLANEAKALAAEALRKEEEVRAIREARAREIEAKIANDSQRHSKFDLSTDLEKIGCSSFIEPLKRAGFADEGAFSRLSDDVLQEHGLLVPRKARVRIVALADSIKRKLEVKNRSRAGALKEVERAMVMGGGGGKKLNTRSVEGLAENFTTKSAINKAFEAKKKAEQRAKNAEEQKAKDGAEALARRNEPKQHDVDTQRLIAAIHWRCTLDEDGLPVNCYRPTEGKFCCPKHEKAAVQRRQEFIEQRGLSNSTALAVRLAAADTLKRGVVSRAAMLSVARWHLNENGYTMDVGEEETRLLLDRCLVPAEQQRRLEAWGRHVERTRCPVGGFPVPVYDARAFVLLLADRMRMCDEKRLLAIERPFQFLPWPAK